MTALSSHTRVAFVGVGRVGGAAPLAVEGKALGSPRGDWEASAQRVTELSTLRCVEPSTLRCAELCRASDPTIFLSICPIGGSLSAESTVLNHTPRDAL